MALPAREIPNEPTLQKAPLEAPAKGEFTTAEEPKNMAQTGHICMFFVKEDYWG